MSFSSSTPAVAEATIPTKDDAAVKEAEEAEKERIRKMQGRKSTILTSGQGDTSQASVQKKSLLGE
jgi:hypothetical protein